MSVDNKNIAVEVVLAPRESEKIPPDLKTVTNFLNHLLESYSNYLNIEIQKDADIQKKMQSVKGFKESVKKDMALVIVDLKYSSFDVAFCPNLDKDLSMFPSRYSEWKKQIFEYFRDNIFSANLDNIEYIKNIREKYTKDERDKIFRPLIKAFRSPHKILVKTPKIADPIYLQPPHRDNEYVYIPISREKQKEENSTFVNALLKVSKTGEIIDKKSIENIISVTPISEDLQPYNTTEIAYEEYSFIFKHEFIAICRKEGDYYFFEYDDLNISVWGETREEAIDAFNFTFYATYLNYGIESDDKLSHGARKLKSKIINLIKEVRQIENKEAE